MSGRNTAMITKQRKWAIDLNAAKKDTLPSPPGYCPNMQISPENQRSPESNKLVIKKSWDVALGPIKGIPMNLFLLYMSGNSISIFPIMMVGMMLMKPVKALWATNASFSNVEGVQTIVQKIVFMLGNIMQLGVALYKCQSLGLLPTHASDWLAFQDPQQQVEFSHGGSMGLW